jgi:hypothetical protein
VNDGVMGRWGDGETENSVKNSGFYVVKNKIEKI